MRKVIGKFLRKIIPFRLYKLIANGFIIIPAYYKGIIDDAERFYDISLEEGHEKDFLLMKKYAHILDKGLHRDDAQPGHSRTYYNLLAETIERLKGTCYAQDPTYKWAKDKLYSYELLQSNPQGFKPLEGNKESNLNITYENLLELIKTRRSNRQFKQIRLSDDVMAKITATADWASSSCNKQPIKIFSTNDPDLANDCLTCCKGGTGFSEYIPSFWVFAANVRGYVWPSEIYLPIVDVCLGAQNMLLAATTLNVSGTVLSWAQKNMQEDKKLRELLQIPNDYEIVICAVMGYAQRTFQTPARKNI